MKCIVLAAGYATRLYPLTKDQPKPLLSVGGKPIMARIVEKVGEVKEVDEIFIVTNSKFASHFEEWSASYENPTGKKITVVDDGTTSNDDRLGPVGDIKFVLDFCEKRGTPVKEDLMVLGGDNLFECSLKKFADFYKSKGASALALYDLKDLDAVRNKFGVVELGDDHKVVDFVEKPSNPKSALAATCMYIYKHSDLKHVSTVLDSKDGEVNSGELVAWLMQQGSKVHGFAFDEKWYDIGGHEELKAAHQEYLEREALMKRELELEKKDKREF